MPWKRAKRVRRVTLPLAAVQADGLELRKLGEFRADKEPIMQDHIFMEQYLDVINLIRLKFKKVLLPPFPSYLRSMVGTILPELNPKQLAKLSSTTRYSELY